MWLPSPIYERIPHFYILAGLLFIADGLYLGFDFKLTFVYIGLGVASFAYGVAIFVIRMNYRKARSNEDTAQPPEVASAAAEETVASPNNASSAAPTGHTLQH